MTEYIPLFVMTAALFCICFAGMAVRLIVKGKKMRGGCGSEPEESNDDNTPASCDTCAKLRVNICECDDESGLAGISATATLGRFDDDLDKA